MKFTTNWRAALGTPADREDICRMAEGGTFREAEGSFERKEPAGCAGTVRTIGFCAAGLKEASR
jgi:hypothetical protein